MQGLKVKKLSAYAILPTRATQGSIGYDLYSAVDGIIYPCRRFCCYTDIAIKLPEGCYGRIACRSGLAIKGLSVEAGVVDPDYTGNICVIIHNHSDDPYFLYQGDKIAQLICEQALIPEVAEVQHIDATTRNNRGLGYYPDAKRA